MILTQERYYLIDSKKDFLSWRILHQEDIKPEVKRLHLVHHALDGKAFFRIAYCDINFLQEGT